MLPVLSRVQSRQLDEVAHAELRVPTLLLMENAGRCASDFIRARYPTANTVVVVCGRGNNGGDGFVVARRLLTLGLRPKVVCLFNGAELEGDAGVQASAFAGVGGVIQRELSEDAGTLEQELAAADLVVDALFGTGLTRPLTGRLQRAVERINGAPCPVVALDVPSGLDADTGKVLGVAVRADSTVTFCTHKLGLLTRQGRECAGHVEVVDIGVPQAALLSKAQLTARAELLEVADVARMVERLGRPAHKGEAGRVVIVAGSPGTVGAARLVAHGAHRAGAGLVTVASFAECVTRLESMAWESMTKTLLPRDEGQSLNRASSAADALVVGPGLGLSDEARDVCERVVLECEKPVVVDADALNHFGNDVARIAKAKGPRLLTPHPKEAARLLGTTADEVEGDRYAAVEQLAQKSGALVLLKGVHSLIQSREGGCFVNPTGNSALAVGGSGDVLAGIIAGLGARLPLLDAARVGAWMHGRAAEHCSKRRGTERGTLAREIADELPAVFAELSAEGSAG